MRTIGNIERFLVIGIVVVIGAILAVAIKGADDLEGAYKKTGSGEDERRQEGGRHAAQQDRSDEAVAGSRPHPRAAKVEGADARVDRDRSVAAQR